jgi:conjugative transposon TraM protein
MMKINLKQPKYILPLVALPFICLFFYVYHSGTAKNKKEVKHLAGINSSVGDVSPEIKKKDLDDKLDAFRNTYKESDGNTAVNVIPSEHSNDPKFNDPYNTRQKRTLDSINEAMKKRYSTPGIPDRGGTHRSFGVSKQDQAMAQALNNLSNRQKEVKAYQGYAEKAKEKDPMDIFKQQMAYMDSIQKASDPAYKAEKAKQAAMAKAEALKAKEIKLTVTKASTNADAFNTVQPQKQEGFIMAVIDENTTGYESSRIKLKLLEDIVAGKILVKKGTYLYALITGFSGQRVTLAVKSIAYNNMILPVKLDIYDLDGLPGLYVPESQFRDFTKDASTNVMQGVDVESTSTSFVMSAADKLFESTSSAIASAIRKNKAKIKYNSYIYLIDNEALQNAQKLY